MTLQVASLFRLGPWYCYQCETKKIWLPRVNSNAPTFCSEDASIHFSQQDEGDAGGASSGVEPVGNYLKCEQSLLLREQRTKRYSQKFRDGTARRVLKDPSLVKTLCRELNLQESDIVSWIASLVQQKQERINELTQLLENLQAGGAARTRLEMDQNSIADEEPGEGTSQMSGEVVEGRILPR